MKHQVTPNNTKQDAARKGVRRYASPLRAEQAEQTRLRIIRAYGDEVCSGQTDDVTIQQVAARAGVALPTLYRNFASLDALSDAYWAWVEPQIGSFAAIKSADDLPAFAEGVFKQFDEREALIRAMLATRSGRRLRGRTVQRRNQEFQRALAPLTRRMSEREARAVTAVCKVMSGGAVWQLMREDWGLDGAEAGRAVAWAMRVLIEALRKNPNPLKKKKRGL
jgi:AcrR family transcriptional regulator